MTQEWVGVAGIGSIGAQHVSAFQAIGAQVVAWDAVASADQVQERVGPGAVVVPTFDGLLERATLGIVIASPDQFHADQVAAADRAGLAVLVEKPVAPTADEVSGLLAELIHPERVLVGYVLHHHASMQRAKTLVEAGAIGRVLSFHATVGAHDTLRLAKQRFADGRENTLYIDYSHEWDCIRWFAGDMDSVAAVAATRGELPIIRRPNIVDVLLAGPQSSGTAHLDYVQDPGLRELTLVGDGGSLTVSATKSSLRLRPRDRADEVIETFDSTRTTGLEAQARHFVDVAREGATPAVSLADGRAALRIAEAVRSAAETGQWTTIPHEESNT